MGKNPPFRKAGLLDEIQIHWIPILIGKGTGLFNDLSAGPIELETTGVIESPGVPHLQFRIIK